MGRSELDEVCQLFMVLLEQLQSPQSLLRRYDIDGDGDGDQPPSLQYLWQL